jgi:uncharacterized membrane protein
VFLLCALGVAAAAGRSAFPADLTTRLDPFRTRLLASLGRTDPLAHERPEELARFDRPFAAHPRLTLLHVVPGGLFLALAPLQFSARMRSRHLRIHRWAGRALLLAGAASAAPAFYFGLLMPFGGPVEAAAIALFGALFVASLARAFVAVRRGQVDLHREWMIRAFAVAVAISTIRVIGAALDLALVTAGVPPRVGFVIALWAGWIVTVGAAEVWIRRTRPAALALTRTSAAPRSTGALPAR